MSDSIIPPTDLVLAALHAIKNAVDQTNVQLKETNVKLDKLTDRVERLEVGLDSLRVFTVQKLTELNTKVDEGFTRQGAAIDRNTAEVHELRERFDHFLTGQGAKLNQRMDKVEAEVARIAAKVDH